MNSFNPLHIWAINGIRKEGEKIYVIVKIL
jgi:hypothetical protein